MPLAKRVRKERNIVGPARRIRDLREDHDLSQEKIAHYLHVAQRTYADYELGNVRIPVDILINLARYYNVDMNYICGITIESNKFPGNFDYTVTF